MGFQSSNRASVLPRTSEEYRHSKAAIIECGLALIETSPSEGSDGVYIEEQTPPHLLKGDEPFRDVVTVRLSTIRGFLFRWNGTVTEYIWPEVLAYGMYCGLCSVIMHVDCPDEPTRGDPLRCRILGDVVKADKFEAVFVLWTAFSAFLFQSFVNAGLQRYNETLSYVRRVQGRYHELGLLLNSHALPPAEHTLCVIRRWGMAMLYLLFDNPVYSPHHGDFTPLVNQILEPEEIDALSRMYKKDRPHAIMTWILTLCQTAINADCSNGQEPLFLDNSGTLGLQIARCLESLRGTTGSLTDSLDDAIVPLPFASLIVLNAYLEFLMLPWAMASKFGYYIIPAAMVFFWFIDGMLYITLMAGHPFLYTAPQCAKRRVKQEPLIDIHKVIAEIASNWPRRYPTGLASRPKSATELVRSPNKDESEKTK